MQDRPLATSGPRNTKPADDSATEDSDDEEHLILKKHTTPIRPPDTSSLAYADKKADHLTSGSELPKRAQSPVKKSTPSDYSPPPVRPPASKKFKQAASSSSDSDGSDKVAAGPSTRRGARQPLKRGGKRF